MSASSRQRQAGYTLVELIIALAIGTMVMGSLVSIVLTTSISANVASGRIDASGQIRNFQLAAYDDVTFSSVPTPSGCGTPGDPCTSQPIQLQGQRVPNVASGAPAPYSVTYTWDPVGKTVTRQSGSGSRTVARDVTAFLWYVDGSGAQPAIVITLTVTATSYNATYSETQSFLFVPRVTAP